MFERITKPQIAKIWACAHAIGLDRELLYLLVPRGSISSMTRQEASELIEHLTGLQGRRVGPAHPPVFRSREQRHRQDDPNAASQEQRDFIYFLFGRIGWLQEPRRARGFLRKFAKVNSVEEIRERKRAIAITEALKAIYKRSRRRTTENPCKPPSENCRMISA